MNFDRERQVSSTEVYFSTTRQGRLQLPRRGSCSTNRNDWKTRRAAGGVLGQEGRFNRSTFKPVKTTALRLEAKLKTATPPVFRGA